MGPLASRPVAPTSAQRSTQPQTLPPEDVASRPLRLLVALSIVVPVLMLAVAAWVSYQQHVKEVHDRVQRDVNRVYEHGAKVFETFELSARYVAEILTSLPDSEIRAREAELNARIRALTDLLPQLLDVWVLDANGRPLVSGTVYPMPDTDLSDRKYFSVHKTGEATGVYVSEVIDARVADLKFFAITRRRIDAAGNFAGVFVVSIKPEYFTNYYSEFSESSIAALFRGDGYVIARYPPFSPNGDRLAPDGALMRAIAVNPDQGVTVGRSALDDVGRTYAYRRLPHHDIYVTSSLDDNLMIEAWIRDMVRFMVFGVPATFALFFLSLMALRRTRRAAQAHAQLQQEVARRELTERALRQSQKMEAVGRLTGGIAHDFNNLLTAILGNVDLAIRRLPEKDDRMRRLLGSARLASERAATLVQRLLAYSRQHPLEVKSVDVNRLVQGMSELLRRTIGETITVETVLAGGLWKTAVDPNQLENAILNLAINARDAMPDGGRLTIETSNAYLDEAYVIQNAGEMAYGQYILLAVTDSGMGMSKDTIERAFEPFFTTKPAGVGTGLGLSMVYGFVKQSGGHVKIYSEPGEGTTIKLYFPRLADNAELPPWAPIETGDDPAETADPLSDTILLVEDDEEVNRFATEVLREAGFNVIATHDGPNALRLLDANPEVKLLFTDVVLPGGMNGRQVAEEALRRRPELKVLYATGYTRNAIIHDGRLDADVELLTKPFTHDILVNKVRQILGDRAEAASTQS